MVKHLTAWIFLFSLLFLECHLMRLKRNCGSCNDCNNCNNDCNSCNSCVSQCQSNCQQCNSCNYNTCNSKCVKNCNSSCNKCSEKVKEEIEPIIIPPAEPAVVQVNNTNNNLVNLTTLLNINNVVHTFNNISIPVYVNTTNINNINLSDTHESSDVVPPVQQPNIVVVPPSPVNEKPCCHVLHPKRCTITPDGTPKCYIRRTKECSDSCKSQVVTIEEDEEADRSCVGVNSWPYVYCGNYVRRDCNQCYSCDGSYNPGHCFQQQSCSQNCRVAAPSCLGSGCQ